MNRYREHHINMIELNRMQNQYAIDNDYRECPECGNILHDLYCGEHVCECQYEDSRPIDMVKFFELYGIKIQLWQAELLDRINKNRNNIIKEFKVPSSKLGRYSLEDMLLRED